MTPVSFAHRLAHQSGLQADVGVADIALQFLPGNQGRHRVDDDDVDRVRFNQHFGNVHGFFAAAGLAHQERFQFDAQLLGPTGIQSMFGVDEGGNSAVPLGLGDHVQGQRGLAARFRAENLDDTSTRNPLPSQGHVQRQAAGGNAGDAAADSGAQGHDGPFAELLLDLGDGRFEVRMGIEHRFDARLYGRRLGGLRLRRSFLCHGVFRFGFDGHDHGTNPDILKEKRGTLN